MAKTKQPPKRVLIARDTLLARIRRELATKGQQIRRVSPRQRVAGAAEWYVVDTEQHEVVESIGNLEKFARECGALAEWEALES